MLHIPSASAKTVGYSSFVDTIVIMVRIVIVINDIITTV